MFGKRFRGSDKACWATWERFYEHHFPFCETQFSLDITSKLGFTTIFSNFRFLFSKPQFTTDIRSDISRDSIERIGAFILRNSIFRQKGEFETVSYCRKPKRGDPFCFFNIHFDADQKNQKSFIRKVSIWKNL